MATIRINKWPIDECKGGFPTFIYFNGGDPNNPSNYTPVQIVLDSTGRIPVALDGSIDIGDVNILDSSGVKIDPSTLQGQQALAIILSSIDGKLTSPVPVTGSVTVNTVDVSGLAKETGGNLAAIAGKDFATATKQLPDGHAVVVNNFPSEYPLPSAQITTLTPPAAITGFATAAKQLADGHNVAVNNLPAEYPLPTAQVTTLTPPAAITGFATAAKQLADGHNVAVNNLPAEYPLPAAQVTTLTPPAAITGFATSAKQLADGHNVNVSNMIPAVETGLAKDATLTGGTQKTIINEKPPTDASKSNPSMVLSYTGSNLTTIAKTIGGTTYTKTLTWTGANLTAVSAWS